MKIEVLPLKGKHALKALNSFSALLLGLKMLPMYLNYSLQEFYEIFMEKSEAELETYLRQAVALVELKWDEVEAIISFCKDKNGIAYSANNISNLGMKEQHELIVAVCMEIGRIKIDLTSEEEKKNLKISRSTLGSNS